MKLSQAKEYLPFVQAAAEGKTIQYKNKGQDTWLNWDNHWDVCTNGLFSYELRIKPLPTYRPWKPEEVPVGCWYRSKNTIGYISMILTNGKDSGYCIVSDFIINNSYVYSHEELFNSFEHSINNGKTWLPCGVLTQD